MLGTAGTIPLCLCLCLHTNFRSFLDLELARSQIFLRLRLIVHHHAVLGEHNVPTDGYLHESLLAHKLHSVQQVHQDSVDGVRSLT